ncbi:MAG: polyamine aminopropyltransferase [Alphaproteobacteria bacterium]|jgi:spermidine synthase|nr:polyamine aminopropyltransferase [Alphaproteobacteria bacterium]
MEKKWFDEKLYEDVESIGFKQSFLNKEIIVSKKSEFQDIEIFYNPKFGKILVLDGVIQTTEADEFFYHEMFTHVPIIAHGNVKSVLIIGGGDGGILREVLKHKSVEKAVMIEIDGDVIELCKQHMPALNNGAFANSRAEVTVEDGIEYVKNTKNKFDLIIVDSTDPINVGEVLFTDEFYANAKKCLNDGGILTTQSGVPFLQDDELKNIQNKLSKVFKDLTFYVVPVPTYIGSFMCLSFATDNVNLKKLDVSTVEQRFTKENITDLKYYNPQIHVASFALPQYIKKIVSQNHK